MKNLNKKGLLGYILGIVLLCLIDQLTKIAAVSALKGKSPFQPIIRLIDIEDPILIIPNVAFHLTKGKTEGIISKQKEMLS